MKIEVIRAKSEFPEQMNIETIVEFLFEHLDKFGDKRTSIRKAIEYALSTEENKGGFLEVARQDEKISGALVMNETGMSGYIPENILVYVAVKADQRGKGIGSMLIERSIRETQGDIKLHVEYDNPAKKLYEKIGFKSKYADMRFVKSKKRIING